MKRKTSIIATLLLAGIAFLIWFISGKETPSTPPRRIPAKTNRSINHPHPPDRPMSREERIKLGKGMDRIAVPIDFYGCVVGPDGKGIAGASVSYTQSVTGRSLPWVGPGHESGNCATGADGRFEIHGERGFDLTIEKIRKKGYRLAGRDEWSFGYAGYPEPHLPDPARPVEFLMVPENAPKPQKAFSADLKFAWNKGNVRFPLGKDIGTLVIVDPRNDKKPGEMLNFFWKAGIRIDGAAIQELDRSLPPLAPLDGYVDTLDYEFKRLKQGENRNNWKGGAGIRKRYVFRTRKGLYGIMELDLDAASRDDDPFDLSVEVKINKTGSRYLE